MHAFLDLIRSRLRRIRRRQKPIEYKSDLLRDFRGDLWFLILAGYPVNSIRWIFSSELPNLFARLSFDGTLTSLNATIAEAELSGIELDEEYLNLLEYYSAGPWAHNAPAWLREQYGVPLAEPKSGGKDSRKGKGKESGKDVAGEPAGVKTSEEYGREDSFWAMWSKYKAGCPGAADPTSEEVILGVNQGISAILARREGAGVSVGVGTGVVPVVPGVDSVVGSPAGSALAAGPGGQGGSGVVSESEKRIRFLEELALAELVGGVPLNLSPAETVEAYAVGLGEFLKKRVFSSAPGSPGVAGLVLV
jgi:hypothetical protein